MGAARLLSPCFRDSCTNVVNTVQERMIDMRLIEMKLILRLTVFISCAFAFRFHSTETLGGHRVDGSGRTGRSWWSSPALLILCDSREDKTPFLFTTKEPQPMISNGFANTLPPPRGTECNELSSEEEMAAHIAWKLWLCGKSDLLILFYCIFLSFIFNSGQIWSTKQSCSVAHIPDTRGAVLA